MTEQGRWDGTERRRSDRRQLKDRRFYERVYWDRRSGEDRRGHRLYAYRPKHESNPSN